MHIVRSFASDRNARVVAWALIALSALLAINDVSSRLDLQLELASRVCMLLVAAVSLIFTSGDGCARLLAWGLIGVSFDLFWQTDTDAGWQQWAEMVIKYLGVSAGLAALLALTARFGDGTNAVRERIGRLAPWFGLGLATVGNAHGALWITQCQTNCDPDGRLLDAAALRTYDAYLFLDAAIRALMIGLAVAGLTGSTPQQRLLLVAVGCVLFAAGTVVDFSARLLPLDAVFAPAWRNVFDATLTLAFPIVLGIALVRKSLFDVEYALNRALVYSIVLAIVGIPVVVLELVMHFWLSKEIFGVVAAMIGTEAAERLNIELIADVLIGLPLAFAFKPIEEGVDERVSHAFAPEREKRLDVLSDFAERIPMISDGEQLERRLLRTLERGTEATFSDVYVRDAQGAYVPTPSSAAVAPAIGPAAVAELSHGKPLAGARARKLVPTAEIALPMLVGGKLFGAIVCGPKRSEVSYAPDEIKCLAAIAREAGACLFAIRLAA